MSLSRMPFGKVRIHELDELRPPRVMSGDRLPEKWGATFYTPDGEAMPNIPGNLAVLKRTTELWGLYKRLPENRMLSKKFYRAGCWIYVSTVYLGHNHNLGGIPHIWETMVFTDDDWDGEYCWRYSTRNAAYNGHRLVTQTIRESQRARRDAWSNRPTRTRALVKV